MEEAEFAQASGTRADEVFELLRNAIVSGTIAPGTKINEPQLARQHGISRGPLREAIRRLEGCKLVQIRANVGARVISLSSRQLIEIYQIREALESLACGLAATRASAADCQHLRQLLQQHEAQSRSGDWQQYVQHEGDWDFHYQIVRMSGNERLFQLLCEELYHLLRLYRNQTGSAPTRPAQALQQHHQIVDALEAGDSELAELLMRRHIASARDTLLARLPTEAGPTAQAETTAAELGKTPL